MARCSLVVQPPRDRPNAWSAGSGSADTAWRFFLQVEVLLDGGTRHGSDVVKALAFGAKAVLIGRAYLWGLAANGQAGVENVLDVLRNGIDSTLLALGRRSIHDLSIGDVLVPEGFAREPGADKPPPQRELPQATAAPEPDRFSHP